MSWIDVAIIVLLTLLAAYGSVTVAMWVMAERYERSWRSRFNSDGDDRG